MKSNASDFLEIAQCIYEDACTKCIANVSDLRDLDTLRSRVKDEGMSFLTITLPQFASDLEQALARGFIDSTLFRAFGKSGSIPAFLQGMTSLIFNRETGRIFDNDEHTHIHQSLRDHNSTIIECIRQICLAFKKVELPCTPQRVHAALQAYVDTERTFSTYSLPNKERRDFLDVAFMLWSGIIRSISLSDVIPKHGPGATAEGISGNRKYAWRYWYERLEPYFPLVDGAYVFSANDSQELKEVTFISQEHELPVKVITVPKTLKAPRIIAIEPCCMQYTQQALRSVLYQKIETASFTKGHVNFRDQSVNGNMALIGSKTGQLATIDLSDASDRVPRDLALEMFSSHPDLRDAIDACRSTSASLPDGAIVPHLSKFASMGSALCFPVESMYFYTICVMTLLRKRNLPVSSRNIFIVTRDLFVYGDDIIVPTDDAIAVLDNLQKYNCKVNTNKTFYTGKFRESCGVDAYDGELVTPVYIRKCRPENRQQASNLISWVATANLFYKKGYWRTSTHMFRICERILGSLPYVSEMSSGLGRNSYLGYRSVERWNRKYQRFEVKCWVPRPVYRTDRLEGYAALTKCLRSPSPGSDLGDEGTDRLHLERSALHGVAALKRRWVPSLI